MLDSGVCVQLVWLPVEEGWPRCYLVAVEGIQIGVIKDKHGLTSVTLPSKRSTNTDWKAGQSETVRGMSLKVDSG